MSMEGTKLFLFIDVTILYVEKPKDSEYFQSLYEFCSGSVKN